MRRIFLLVLAVGTTVVLTGSTHAEIQDACCYTHPSYTGTCEVTPGDDETCASILEYLNTPNSQGRTYCGGTNLRGGWSLTTCDEAAQKRGQSFLRE